MQEQILEQDTSVGFRHEAMLYRGPDDRVSTITAFARAGLDRGETPVIVVDADVIASLEDALGPDAAAVRFADMRDVGRNPGRLISLWSDFFEASRRDGSQIRGVGEPVWAGRSAEELAECARHEALLNLAFADGPAWRLACPYDVSGLPPAVVDQAHRTHPVIAASAASDASSTYRDPRIEQQTGLRSAPPSAFAYAITKTSLASLRKIVQTFAVTAGLTSDRAADLALAMHEVASNSIRHANETGTARLWRTGEHVIGDVQDAGTIADPMVGRVRPVLGSTLGFGLWLSHQLCDLVELRSSSVGTNVRIRMTIPS